MYHHLTQDRRIALAALLKAGYSQRKAAEQLGMNQSSVSRELARNPRENGSYHATHASFLARKRRRHSKVSSRKIENNAALGLAITAKLHPLVSPEVIARDFPVCHETIYQWISRSCPALKEKLPQRGRKRRRYGSKREIKQGWTKNVRSIHERPFQAEARTQTGHFEGDTVRGVNGALLTLTDRKSRYEIAVKISNEGGDSIHAAIVHDKHALHARSFTFDRGSGFAIWRYIEKDTGARVYFADPHAPWQRGTNENANQRLRRVYPKGTNIGILTQRDIDATVWCMNHTKRKCLNWRTPCEVFKRCCTSN